MKKKIIKNLFCVLFLVLTLSFMFTSAYSERITNFVSTLSVYKDKLAVQIDYELENPADVGVVPGETFFQIIDLDADLISNVSATDFYGNRFQTNVSQEEGFAKITVINFVPLYARSKQRVFLNYDIKYPKSGIFFNSFSYPLTKSTLDLESGRVVLDLQDKFYLTYAPNIKEEDGIYFWEFKDNIESVNFEVSKIPLPRLKIPAVNIFWGLLITFLFLILLIVLFLSFNTKKE